MASFDEIINDPAAIAKANLADAQSKSAEITALESLQEEKQSELVSADLQQDALGAIFGDALEEQGFPLAELSANLHAQVQALNQQISRDEKERALDRKRAAAAKAFQEATTALRAAPQNYHKRKYELYIVDEQGCGTPDIPNLACPALVSAIRKPLELQGDKLMSVTRDRHRQLHADLADDVDQLDTLVSYLERIVELYTIRSREVKQLANAVDRQQYSTWTDQRKVVYEDQWIEFLGSIQYWATVFYYFLFVVYLVVGDFFSRQRYRRWTSWCLVALYMAVPFGIDPLVRILFYIWSQLTFFFRTRAPHDVYATMR